MNQCTSPPQTPPLLFCTTSSYFYLQLLRTSFPHGPLQYRTSPLTWIHSPNLLLTHIFSVVSHTLPTIQHLLCSSVSLLLLLPTCCPPNFLTSFHIVAFSLPTSPPASSSPCHLSMLLQPLFCLLPAVFYLHVSFPGQPPTSCLQSSHLATIPLLHALSLALQGVPTLTCLSPLQLPHPSYSSIPSSLPIPLPSLPFSPLAHYLTYLCQTSHPSTFTSSISCPFILQLLPPLDVPTTIILLFTALNVNLHSSAHSPTVSSILCSSSGDSANKTISSVHTAMLHFIFKLRVNIFFCSGDPCIACRTTVQAGFLLL